ncbi:MAG: hypothetical protein LBD06_01840, partial [Candidatus Accumulibacter sp.]|nr:hypothetical protein [Accumulibacter sp.]
LLELSSETRSPGFSIPPARQRRKLTCPLSSQDSVFWNYPLKLSSVLSNNCPLNYTCVWSA